MPFSIERFKAEIAKSGGFSLSNEFDVMVPSVVGGVNLGIGVAENMTFRIESFSLPPRGVELIDYITYGPSQKIGGFANYIDVDLSVILSPDLRERNYFIKWQDLIVGTHRQENQNAFERRSAFDIGYYNNYTSENITIRKYRSDKETPVYELKLIDAFPSQVGSVGLDWNTVEIQKLNVTLTYRYFVEKVNDVANDPVAIADGASEFSFL